MVYVDSNTFRCYVAQDAEMKRIPVDEPIFSGKCQTFVEGYCCVPDTLVIPDGNTRTAAKAYPWKPYNELAAAQAQYELDIAEAAAAYQEGVNSAYDQ